MQNKCSYIDLGIAPYAKAWAVQEDFHRQLIQGCSVKQNNESNTHRIIFCEHPHVFTLGKSGQENNLLINDDFLQKISATYFKTNRGGDITYHGPGQLVGYPIINLNDLKIGVKKYIYLLEQSIIESLKEYSIDAERFDKGTGVWLDTRYPEKVRKICAIGVRLSRSVTMHGFALNANTDLSYFGYINPCGFKDKGVTSMERELGKKVDLDDLKNVVLKRILYNLNLEIKEPK